MPGSQCGSHAAARTSAIRIGLLHPRCLGPNGPLGMLTESLGLGTFNFSFPGLVIGSVIYSMPFMVQPLVTAFEASVIGRWKLPQRFAAILLMRL